MDVTDKPRNTHSTEVMNTPSRPEISGAKTDTAELKKICPVGAIGVNPVRIDLGKCVFCFACSQAFPQKIRFGTDKQISSNVRDRLIILEGDQQPVSIDASIVRKNLRHPVEDLRLFPFSTFDSGKTPNEILGNELVSAFSSVGISLVNAPSQANGILISGAIDETMTDVLFHCYHAIREPKLVIVAGSEAINSVILSSEAWSKKIPVDLYIPGLHPQTMANGVIQLLTTASI
jgi:hypothetical protein